jgi:hypothetical protein
MSDTDSSDDYSNLSNISNTDLDDEIEIRQFILAGPSRNQSMRSIVETRLNLLLAERNARRMHQSQEHQTRRRNTRRRQTRRRQTMHLRTDAIGNDCPICLNPFLETDIIVDAHNLTNGEPSRHYFHKNCLLQLCNRPQNSLCPLCRMSVNCNHIQNGNRNLRRSSGGFYKKRVLSKHR